MQLRRRLRCGLQRAHFHKVGLAHDKGDLILMHRAQLAPVVVGYGGASLVGLVPVVEAVDKRAARPVGVQLGCAATGRAVHLVGLDAGQLLHVANAAAGCGILRVEPEQLRE